MKPRMPVILAGRAWLLLIQISIRLTKNAYLGKKTQQNQA
jgi:hypothetical protein